MGDTASKHRRNSTCDAFWHIFNISDICLLNKLPVKKYTFPEIENKISALLNHISSASSHTKRFYVYMSFQHHIRNCLVRKWLLGTFQSSSWLHSVCVLSVPPCSCSVASHRTNRQKATAFPLIVISLSQEELSRDRAHTEQFSSPPIQTATVFAEAEQLNGGKTTKRERDLQNDERQIKLSFLHRTLERLLHIKNNACPLCVAVVH